MFNPLDFEAMVLRSIHGSGVLIMVHYVDRQHALTGGHCELGRCFIHEPQDLAYVGRRDLRVKAINKGNNYLDCH